MKELLLRANSIEGITTADIIDYPEADVMSFADFRDSLRDCVENDIFTSIMPKGTDGYYEILDEEYGIR